MFIFSEDVQVQNLSASTAQMGIYGPQAARALARCPAGNQSSIPSRRPAASIAAADASATRDFRRRSGHVAGERRRWGDGVRRHRARGPDKDAFDRPAGAAGAVDAVAPDAAEVCRIEGGRPLLVSTWTEDTIPLEAGIEDRAISLTKGCYVGQEIIIRVLHRGHGRVARKLVGLSLEIGRRPARGGVIRSAERDRAVTSAVHSHALGRAIALGYVHRDFTTLGTPLTIHGAAATVAALPFV